MKNFIRLTLALAVAWCATLFGVPQTTTDFKISPAVARHLTIQPSPYTINNVKITYVGSHSFDDVASSGTVLTITGVPIGEAASDRLIVAEIHPFDENQLETVNVAAPGATIGGVSATMWGLSFGGSADVIAHVPTGTTATFELAVSDDTGGDTEWNGTIIVYSVTNANVDDPILRSGTTAGTSSLNAVAAPTHGLPNAPGAGWISFAKGGQGASDPPFSYVWTGGGAVEALDATIGFQDETNTVVNFTGASSAYSAQGAIAATTNDYRVSVTSDLTGVGSITDLFTNPYIMIRPAQSTWPTVKTTTRATCVTDTTDLTTYTFNGISTGAADSDTVLIVVGIIAEDTVGNFNVSSATIEGTAAFEIIDEAGSGIVNTAFYISTSYISNAASIDVTVTHSEAVTSSGVCVWTVSGGEFGGSRVWASATAFLPAIGYQDDDTASGPVIPNISTNYNGAFVATICTNSGVADSYTETENDLTEREDTQNAEVDYATSDGTMTGDGSETSYDMCDWTGGNDASGSVILVR